MDYIGNELEIFDKATNWKEYWFSAISRHLNGKVLEVGAGLGSNTMLLNNHSKVTSITCLEPDKKLFAQLKEKSAQLSKVKSVINSTIQFIEEEKYDVIIYIDVLEHIDDVMSEVVAMKRCLSEDGKIIILVPAYQYLFSDFDKAIGHFRRYNKGLLLSQLTPFRKDSVFYLDSMGYFASLANKTLLKKSEPSASNIKFWDSLLIPASRWLFDIIFMRSFGKSLIGVFKA